MSSTTTLRNGRVHLDCPHCEESLATTPAHRVRISESGITATPRLVCPSCFLILEVTRGRIIKHGRRAKFPHNEALIIALEPAERPGAVTVDISQDTGEPEDADESKPEKKEYSYRDLQEECKDRGLSAKGSRQELEDRIAAYDADEEE